MSEDSFDDFQLRRYREEKADGKGQHSPTDRREDVSRELRPDFRQEAVAEQGVAGTGTKVDSKLTFYTNGRAVTEFAIDALHRRNADTPFFWVSLKPRYVVRHGSVTGHCCFVASVLDILNDALPICECMDLAEADRICTALNRKEQS